MAVLTELGAPVGAGVADWDLEAFWNSVRGSSQGPKRSLKWSSPRGSGVSDLKGPDALRAAAIWRGGERDHGAVVLSSSEPTQTQDLSAGAKAARRTELIAEWPAWRPLREEWASEASSQADHFHGTIGNGIGEARGTKALDPLQHEEDVFWDASSCGWDEDLFHNAREHWAEEPQAAAAQEPSEAPKAAVLESDRESEADEELDRWMGGSMSHTTEDSTACSATSSAVDLSEFATGEGGSGGAKSSTPDQGGVAPRASSPGALWALGRFMAPGQCGAAKVHPEAAPEALPSCKPPPAPPSSGCMEDPLSESLVRQASGEEGRGALDVIPDLDLAELMEAVEEVDAEVRLLQAKHSSYNSNAEGVRSNQPSSKDTAESTTPLKAERSSGRSKWRLIMAKSHAGMQYTSWVRDKGGHFGAMEFRGRMVIMPGPAQNSSRTPGVLPGTPAERASCPKNQQGSGEGGQAGGGPSGTVQGSGDPGSSPQPQSQQPWWGPEAVRDFLLDEMHRAEWDDGRELSEMLEEWDETGCSTARWVRKLPLFLRSREYVVGRRVWSPRQQPRTYYCISRSMDHPAAPLKPQLVRASAFYSSWRVRALSREETAKHGLLLQPQKRGGRGQAGSEQAGCSCSGRGASRPQGQGQCACKGQAQAVEIITHYEEESGLPKDLLRMGVAHSMWGHMVKMEEHLRLYCASGRNLRHLLPVFMLQAEQQAAAAEEGAAVTAAPLGVAQ